MEKEKGKEHFTSFSEHEKGEKKKDKSRPFCAVGEEGEGGGRGGKKGRKRGVLYTLLELTC